jgi:hypothetical protein
MPAASTCPGASAAMLAWRTALRSGDYLLTALAPDHAMEHGPERCRDSFRATVITAARTAGLTWQQELLVVTAPLPAQEPRATPDTAMSAPTVLVDGRHLPVHVKVLAFRNETGDATHG